MVNYQEGFHPYGGYGKRPAGEGGGSGGGGGVQFINIPYGTNDAPVVGESASLSKRYPFGFVRGMSIDGTEIIDADEGGTFTRFIVGSTVKQDVTGVTMLGAYVVTLENDLEPIYNTVTTWDTGNYSVVDEYLTYTVPNLADDEYLIFVTQ